MATSPMDEPRKIGKPVRSASLLDAMILVAAAAAVLTVSRGPEWMAMLWIWGVHSVIGAVLSSPVVFLGRKRVHWGRLELLAFLLPFAVWAALMNESSTGKSLGNLGEPFLFAVAIPVAAMVRVIVGAHVEEKVMSIILVASLCLCAAGVYWLTPALPE